MGSRRAHKQVLRLDVAVDHVLGVTVVQSTRDLVDVLRALRGPATCSGVRSGCASLLEAGRSQNVVPHRARQQVRERYASGWVECARSQG